MLQRQKILQLFESLDTELGRRGVTGEIGLCGGAVMCLVFKARESTKDVDGIFEPTGAIREASREVAARMDVREDWLNDAAKAYFLTQPPRQEVLSLPHLRVWAPTAEYMLAMKCVSARFDTHDLDDVRFLLRHLDVSSVGQAFEIVERFYPRRHIPPKTQFLIEELLGPG